MTTQIFYHGTKERNRQKIIDSRKIKQVVKEYSQSEEGFVYICHEKDFDQTISYAMDPSTSSFTFVKMEIIVDSEVYKNLQYEEKESLIGTLKSYKYNGEIDLSDKSIISAKIINLKKPSKEYFEFHSLVTAYPPKYDEAKSLLDILDWEPL
jgi:hypothetical protein